jgi:hypothetical protein
MLNSDIDEEAQALSRFCADMTRTTRRQSRRDADIAASLVRILRDEVRGVARGIGHELRQLIGEITNG